MPYRISGLPSEPFAPLFGREAADLAALGAVRYIADEKPGFPCRVTLEDAEPGEHVLLVNYVHQPAATPYRAAHAIFVREGATRMATFVDEVPASLRIRSLSVRAFDLSDMMIDAELVEGSHLEGLIEQLFTNAAVAYLHVHNAKRGCYAARIERVIE